MKPDQATQSRLLRLVSSFQPLQGELSLPQLLALARIALEPGLSVNELAERLDCAQQTASRHVAALLGRYQGSLDAQSGAGRSALDPLISQEINKSDPRSRALYPSKQGAALLERIISKLDMGVDPPKGGKK